MEILDYLNLDRDKNILLITRLPHSEVIFYDGEGLVLKDDVQYYMKFLNESHARQVLKDKKYKIFFTPDKYCADAICDDYISYYQYLKTDNKLIDIPENDFRVLDESYLDIICANYKSLTRDDILKNIKNNKMYGLFVDNVFVGFVGTHFEQGLGMLKVLDEYVERGYGYTLEASMINKLVSNSQNIYCHVSLDNYKSLNLQDKLGLTRLDKLVYWKFYEEQ